MLVRLNWEHSVQDHPRPRLPLWRRIASPASLKELIIQSDGAVIEAETLHTDEYEGVSVRHGWVGHIDSPIAQTLAAHGYQLDAV